MVKSYNDFDFASEILQKIPTYILQKSLWSLFSEETGEKTNGPWGVYCNDWGRRCWPGPGEALGMFWRWTLKYLLMEEKNQN